VTGKLDSWRLRHNCEGKRTRTFVVLACPPTKPQTVDISLKYTLLILLRWKSLLLSQQRGSWTYS
jgi:hypothetical protein